jgi:hypothetical protein
MRSLGAFLLLVLCGPGSGSELIIMPQGVPPEVRSIVDETSDRFSAAFEAHHDCFSPVPVLLVRDLGVDDADARYSRRNTTIEVLIPTSPERFPEALVHELAHHLDETCSGIESVRPSFARAQGFPTGTPWTAGADWQEIPAEHFAEAVVQLVRDERLLHDDRITLAPESMRLLGEWARNATPPDR